MICNDAHRFIVAEQLRAIGVEPKAVVIEPQGRNTAPAACVAALALLATEPDALMLVMPSGSSRCAVPPRSAPPSPRRRRWRASGRLVTFGIQPMHPATAYGYIKRGEAIGRRRFTVERFVEKPDAVTAADFSRRRLLLERRHLPVAGEAAISPNSRADEPAIVPACRAALAQGKTDLFFFRLDPDAFASVPSQSIDYGVMERTDKAAVVPVEMGWSDVGSWSALHQETAQDGAGNTLLGDVIALDTESSYVRSERQLTAVIGIKNAVVIVTADAVLVADKSHDQQVKQVVEQLKSARAAPKATAQARHVHRPWGWFQTMDEGHRFKVKRLCVKPGAKLSLQKHWHRSEHWVVVTGTALVTRGDEDFTLRENESTYIAAGTKHRLANPGHVELHMIEVQSGEYVGEDDIVRIADDYGRTDGGTPAARRSAPAPKPPENQARQETTRSMPKRKRQQIRRGSPTSEARRRKIRRKREPVRRHDDRPSCAQTPRPVSRENSAKEAAHQTTRKTAVSVAVCILDATGGRPAECRKGAGEAACAAAAEQRNAMNDGFPDFARRTDLF